MIYKAVYRKRKIEQHVPD